MLHSFYDRFMPLNSHAKPKQQSTIELNLQISEHHLEKTQQDDVEQTLLHTLDAGGNFYCAA